MTQNAVVIKTKNPSKAEVEVLRGTSCGDACGSCNICQYASKIRVEAINGIHAGVGDRVEIETKSSNIYKAAVLVYIMPFVLFFIGYALSAKLGTAENISVLMSFAFFAVGMLIAVIVGRAGKKKQIDFTITRIIEDGDSL